MDTIKLTDGTELEPLKEEVKVKLEKEIAEVLNKYNAMYLPVIREDKTLTNISQTAVLYLLKKKVKEEDKGEVVSPIQTNEKGNNTNKETPKAN